MLRTIGIMKNVHLVRLGRFDGLDDVTVIVPTRNEAENVVPLLERLLPLRPSAVIFVDDSDDHTPDVIELADDPRVAVMHRGPGERGGGLGGAVTAGFAASTTTWVAVIDGDLQHPPEVLTELYQRTFQPDRPDVVIASRYLTGGSSKGLSGFHRVALSSLGTVLVRSFRPRHLVGVSDPLSGCFLLRRDRVDLSSLQPDGFKILLEILLSVDGLRTADVPYEFSTRLHGSSNAGLAEIWRLCRTAFRAR